MRCFSSLSLVGSCALALACGAPDAPAAGKVAAELGALTQEITGTTLDSFSDSLEEGESAARGPFAVRPGAQLLVTLAGTGDADLYVRFDSRPTLDSFDCRPYSENASEQCRLTVPADAKTVYVNVEAYTASSYSLKIEQGASGSIDGQSKEPFLIAVLGSSTAEGEGASSQAKSWVGLLGAELAASANVSVVNFSVGGYSTLELLPHTGTDNTIDDIISEAPDLIVISLAGGNDVSLGTSTSTYLQSLSKASRRAQAAGIPTFFVGTAPKNSDDEERALLGDWNQQMRSRFSSCWSPTNPAYSPCFIDVLADLGNTDHEIQPQYDSGDGIHVNDAGHRVVFNRSVDIIEQYVCTVTDCR